MSIGQSSVEYITTYGWMLLAVSTAASVTYTYVDPSCTFNVQGVSRTSGLSVERVGAQGDDIKMVVESQTYEQIKIESIKIESEYDSVEVLPPQVIDPGESAVLDLGKTSRSDVCRELDTTINFERGPLKNQTHTVRIEGPVALNSTIDLFLKRAGDTISELQVQASVKPTNDTICIGSNCPTNKANVSKQEEVSYGGDVMLGTLRTSKIQSGCYGDNCTQTIYESGRYVRIAGGEMNGTLNVSEIKPVTDSLSTLTISGN